MWILKCGVTWLGGSSIPAGYTGRSSRLRVLSHSSALLWPSYSALLISLIYGSPFSTLLILWTERWLCEGFVSAFQPSHAPCLHACSQMCLTCMFAPLSGTVFPCYLLQPLWSPSPPPQVLPSDFKILNAEHRNFTVQSFTCKLKLKVGRNCGFQSEKAIISSLRFKVKINWGLGISVLYKKDGLFLCLLESEFRVRAGCCGEGGIRPSPKRL